MGIFMLRLVLDSCASCFQFHLFRQREKVMASVVRDAVAVAEWTSNEAREERIECVLVRQVEPSLQLPAAVEPHDRNGFEHLGFARDGGAEALEGHDVVVRP